MNIIERMALALLNDDRVRHGLPSVTTMERFGDCEAYRSSARAALAAAKYSDGWDEDVAIKASRIGFDASIISEVIDAYIDAALA
jgi:hypothetical protein